MYFGSLLSLATFEEVMTFVICTCTEIQTKSVSRILVTHINQIIVSKFFLRAELDISVSHKFYASHH